MQLVACGLPSRRGWHSYANDPVVPAKRISEISVRVKRTQRQLNGLIAKPDCLRDGFGGDWTTGLVPDLDRRPQYRAHLSVIHTLEVTRDR